jgi:hypothetical protein
VSNRAVEALERDADKMAFCNEDVSSVTTMPKQFGQVAFTVHVAWHTLRPCPRLDGA